MKPACEVIQDLLPLYVEDMVSAESGRLIEQHLQECPTCQKQLNAMQAPQEISKTLAATPLRKLKGRLLWTRLEGIILTATLALVFAIALGAYLTAPEYLPLSDNLLSLQELEGGALVITFNEQVAGYDVNTSFNEAGELVHHITAWNTRWSRLFPSQWPQSLVLRPEGQQGLVVYYYQEGAEDTLIYGEAPYSSGGVATLPRLTLTYYLLLAALVAAGLGILRWLCRGHELLKGLIDKLLLLPAAYWLGHLCIKGFSTRTYSLLRDFAAILLIAVPIYCVLLLVLYLSRKRRLLQRING